jgi:RHS repeat-associated protein
MYIRSYGSPKISLHGREYDFLRKNMKMKKIINVGYLLLFAMYAHAADFIDTKYKCDDPDFPHYAKYETSVYFSGFPSSWERGVYTGSELVCQGYGNGKVELERVYNNKPSNFPMSHLVCSETYGSWRVTSNGALLAESYYDKTGVHALQSVKVLVYQQSGYNHTVTEKPFPKTIRFFYLGAPLVDCNNPGQGKADTRDPINTINGAMHFSETDIVIPCPGMPIIFSRSYNSVLNTELSLGPRWMHSYAWYLCDSNKIGIGVTNQYKVLYADKGKTDSFKEVGIHQYDRPFGSTLELIHTNNQYLISIPPSVHGSSTPIQYIFNTNGVLHAISDKWDNQVTLTYTNTYPDHVLTRVEHSNGQGLDLIYTSNQLTKVEYSTNLFVSFSYNAQNELTNSVRYVNGEKQSINYLYDVGTNYWNHSLTQRVNAAGHMFNYTYQTNTNGQATSKAVSMKLDSHYYEHEVGYFTASNMTTVTYNRNGTDQKWDYYYDPTLNVVQEIRGPNPDIYWGIHGKGTSFDYDENGNLSRIQVVDNSVDEYLLTIKEYDHANNVTNESFGFNAASTQHWEYTWNNDHTLNTATDPEGHKVAYTYKNGLISTISYPDDPVILSQFSYTTNGLLSAVTNANGHWVHYEYNSYGFPTSSIPQVGPVIHYEYDQYGHVTKMIQPSLTNGLMRTTELDVDELGRVRNILYADGSEESFEYDVLGNLTNHIDIAGRETVYTWLPTRKLSSIQYKGLGTNDYGQVTFIYDNQFNSLTIKDTLNRVVEAYNLDIQDRPISVTNVEGQVMTITYGVADMIRSMQRYDGTDVSYMYDEGARISSVSYPNSTNGFTYYGNGLLKSAKNESCESTYQYDVANRLTQEISNLEPETLNFELTNSYTYYPAGQVSNISSQAGSYQFGYDEAERISHIKNQKSKIDFTYNPHNGLIASIAYSNGVLGTYSYDELDRITRIDWMNGTSNVLKHFEYSYNTAGMMDAVQSSSGERMEYEYDELDRLIREQQWNKDSEEIRDDYYAYDVAGNRTEKEGMVGLVEYWMNGGNRLEGWRLVDPKDMESMRIEGYSNEPIGQDDRWGTLWVSNALMKVTPEIEGTNFWVETMDFPMGTQSVVAAIRDEAGNMGYATNTIFLSVITNGVYTYNSAGCLTNVLLRGVEYSSERRLAWNDRYELVTVAGGDDPGKTEQYKYDAAGRRIAIITGTSTNWMIYDGIHVIAEVDANGNLLKSYTYGPGVDSILSMTVYGASTNTYYYVRDHLNTVHALTDEQGDIVEEYRYDAWGRISVYDGSGNSLKESAIGNRYTFQGREYSWTTKFYYFRARYYDPYQGRWLSKDPIGISGGLNQYQAFNNNPVNYIDPDGLIVFFVHGTWSSSAQAFDPPFFRHVMRYFNDKNARFYNWSGDNCDKERKTSGFELGRLIREYRKNHPNEPICVVGHSHGGNVALIASHVQGVRIDTLVTLGTPIMSVYQPGPGIRTWHNIYSINDRVQTLPLRAQRRHSNAKNHRLTGFSHSALHTMQAWDVALSP